MNHQQLPNTPSLSENELCPDDLLAGQERAFAIDIERLQKQINEFVSVACPACQSVSSQFAFEKHRFRYETCNDCKTIFMNPRPTPEIMASYYDNSENYRYWAKYIFPASEKARRDKIQKPWLERVIGYCKKLNLDGGTLVEVGAGFGIFAELAQNCGYFKRVIAVERTPEMADACRARGVSVVQAPIEQVTNELHGVDVVVAFEVIEHLFAPHDFISQCQKLLRPGGLLVVSCPNGLGFDISVLREHSLAVDPEHVNLFNPDALKKLLQRSGFRIAEITTPGRLDAEFVRTAILQGSYLANDNTFIKRLLLDHWNETSGPFQDFLAQNMLSSHMWCAAQHKSGTTTQD